MLIVIDPHSIQNEAVSTIVRPAVTEARYISGTVTGIDEVRQLVEKAVVHLTTTIPTPEVQLLQPRQSSISGTSRALEAFYGLVGDDEWWLAEVALCFTYFDGAVLVLFPEADGALFSAMSWSGDGRSCSTNQVDTLVPLWAALR